MTSLVAHHRLGSVRRPLSGSGQGCPSPPGDLVAAPALCWAAQPPPPSLSCSCPRPPPSGVACPCARCGCDPEVIGFSPPPAPRPFCTGQGSWVRRSLVTWWGPAPGLGFLPEAVTLQKGPAGPASPPCGAAPVPAPVPAGDLVSRAGSALSVLFPGWKPLRLLPPSPLACPPVLSQAGRDSPLAGGWSH